MELDQRFERFKQILKLFLIPSPDCIYEINTSHRLVQRVLDQGEECPSDLFDEIVEDLLAQTLCVVYMRFLQSEIYQEMVKSTQTGIRYKVMYLMVK
jgi:hypothetical protein